MNLYLAGGGGENELLIAQCTLANSGRQSGHLHCSLFLPAGSYTWTAKCISTGGNNFSEAKFRARLFKDVQVIRLLSQGQNNNFCLFSTGKDRNINSKGLYEAYPAGTEGSIQISLTSTHAQTILPAPVHGRGIIRTETSPFPAHPGGLYTLKTVVGNFGRSYISELNILEEW